MMMKASIAFGLLVLAVAASASTVAPHYCWTEADCNGGCCTPSAGGNVCQPLAKVNEVCDLEGQGLAHNACKCESGLSCEKIDLGLWGEVAASANPILEKHHYGWCELKDSVVGK